MRRPAALTAALCLALAAGPAHARTRRLAVLVGSSLGGDAARELRYSEADARKLGSVLVELGNVAPEDLIVLEGPSLSRARQAFAAARAQVARWRRDPADRVVLLFYFSGHSDGVALELGRDRLEFRELREWLDSSGADVRVAIVDSCRSGALLAAKGGSQGPAFQIQLGEDVASSGSAYLTSSAADELALESREVGGSLFTHHLVSALRGAGDASGDGQVTLAEAYQYAFQSTLLGSSSTFVGRQHPAYDYRLTGQGDLVLTQLLTSSGSLAFATGLERVLIVHWPERRIVAELGGGGGGGWAERRIAVPPGEYEIHAVQEGRPLEGRVRVAAGETRTVARGDLRDAPWVAGAAKGGADATVALVGAGGEWSVALGPMARLRAGASLEDPGAFAAGLDVAYRPDDGTAPVRAGLWGSARYVFRWGRLSAGAGAEAGLSLITQWRSGQLTGWAVAPGLGPAASVSWALGQRMSLQGGLSAPVLLLSSAGQPLLSPQLAVTAELRWHLQ